ncbi:hypothetical protein GCM10025867_38490 [Frondihabitans sucicola]|uniref:Uncharacterized protein n=1 Tax=Frondihabitans sucicola TaxID=1268041 RepID=A0ABM8GT06_9MICO|nr:hypothetical protein [Frondihabitans sucicola]BDZ51608.1 hypothetical protein GCM10025867_38490 [Frondihabitans sucicola]
MDPEIADRPSDPALEAGLPVQARMAASLARSLDGTDWAEGTLFWSSIDGTRIARLETLDLTGHPREHPLPADIDALGDELRVAMATPERGSWLSMTLELTRDGAFTSRFNFDRRVYDNPATPFSPGALGAVPSDESYANDLLRHPRSARYALGWLAERPSAARPVSAPYDVLADAWGWPGVFASVELQASLALAQQDPAGPLTRDLAEGVGRRVLRAVVADVLEPHRLATLLRLHGEAVARRLLPAVDGADALDPDQPLLAAREESSAALLALEAGVYGIIGDLVRSRLAAA